MKYNNYVLPKYNILLVCYYDYIYLYFSPNDTTAYLLLKINKYIQIVIPEPHDRARSQNQLVCRYA